MAVIPQPAWFISVFWQLLTVLLLATILWFVDRTWAWSALLGGMIAVIPNAYFARQVFRYSGAGSTQAITRSFYRGEAGKFVTTAFLFAGVFVLVEPLALSILFASYIGLLVMNSILAGWLLRRGRSGNVKVTAQ